LQAHMRETGSVGWGGDQKGGSCPSARDGHAAKGEIKKRALPKKRASVGRGRALGFEQGKTHGGKIPCRGPRAKRGKNSDTER